MVINTSLKVSITQVTYTDRNENILSSLQSGDCIRKQKLTRPKPSLAADLLLKWSQNIPASLASGPPGLSFPHLLKSSS